MLSTIKVARRATRVLGNAKRSITQSQLSQHQDFAGEAQDPVYASLQKREEYLHQQADAQVRKDVTDFETYERYRTHHVTPLFSRDTTPVASTQWNDLGGDQVVRSERMFSMWNADELNTILHNESLNPWGTWAADVEYLDGQNVAVLNGEEVALPDWEFTLEWMFPNPMPEHTFDFEPPILKEIPGQEHIDIVEPNPAVDIALAQNDPDRYDEVLYMRQLSHMKNYSDIYTDDMSEWLQWYADENPQDTIEQVEGKLDALIQELSWQQASTGLEDKLNFLAKAKDADAKSHFITLQNEDMIVPRPWANRGYGQTDWMYNNIKVHYWWEDPDMPEDVRLGSDLFAEKVRMLQRLEEEEVAWQDVKGEAKSDPDMHAARMDYRRRALNVFPLVPQQEQRELEWIAGGGKERQGDMVLQFANKTSQANADRLSQRTELMVSKLELNILDGQVQKIREKAGDKLADFYYGVARALISFDRKDLLTVDEYRSILPKILPEVDFKQVAANPEQYKVVDNICMSFDVALEEAVPRHKSWFSEFSGTGNPRGMSHSDLVAKQKQANKDRSVAEDRGSDQYQLSESLGHSSVPLLLQLYVDKSATAEQFDYALFGPMFRPMHHYPVITDDSLGKVVDPETGRVNLWKDPETGEDFAPAWYADSQYWQAPKRFTTTWDQNF